MYGRNANRIITLANALKEAQNRNLTVGLDKKWSSWYSSWFDDQNIETNYFGACSVKMDAKLLYFSRPLSGHNAELHDLRPKRKFWRHAFLLLKNKNIVTVHRRWLEGECKKRAKSRQYFCSSSSDFSQTCFWTQADIEEKVGSLIRNNVIPTQQKILLLSDHQNKVYDNTFKFQIRKKFQIEMCMMALSTAHFGNPMSSIDYIVAHWRSKLQFPLECFGQIHKKGVTENKERFLS